MEATLVFLFFVWGLPILICYRLGQSRNRAGWPWGLFLGWLGVLIVALMRPLHPHEWVQIRQAEAQSRLERATPDNPTGIYPPPPSRKVAEAQQWLDREISEGRL